MKVLFDTRKKAYPKSIRVLCWVVVLLYLGGIFLLSNQDGIKSNQISKGIVKEVKERVVLPPMVAGNAVISKVDYNLLLRKVTHFMEYFFLCLLIYVALRITGVKHGLSLGIALLLCCAYAVTDEYHQMFVSGRTSLVRDVLIDVSGAAVAYFLIYLIKPKLIVK